MGWDESHGNVVEWEQWGYNHAAFHSLIC